MADRQLHFDGPYTFTAGDRSLFHSPCAKAAGVYLWTFRQHADGSHLIHYVGETKAFAKRHREHLIHVLSLNYGLFDPDKAQQGISEVCWPGLWRRKSADGPTECLKAYGELNDVVLRYVQALTCSLRRLLSTCNFESMSRGVLGGTSVCGIQTRKFFTPMTTTSAQTRTRPTGFSELRAAR